MPEGRGSTDSTAGLPEAPDMVSRTKGQRGGGEMVSGRRAAIRREDG